MTSNSIEAHGIGKCYTLTHEPMAGGQSLRDAWGGAVRRVVKLFSRATEPSKRHESFWALRDVSFDVRPGDRVALIGRNGAGKSTLLKVISRITAPTTGRALIRGRVASLLEIGTGFHGELSGRENIYLNGAILGMSRSEIRKVFDAIVAFADVERFLDTPVKRFSSGMFLRLAFAVAAHVDPDVLILDEVLAVGDVAFQKKCFDQMKKIGAEGRTILFVSHNMGLVNQLCTRGLYLKQGRLVLDAPVETAVASYLKEGASAGSADHVLAPDPETARQTKSLFFHRVSIAQEGREDAVGLDVRAPIDVCVDYEVTRSLPNAELSVRIETQEGRPVFTSHQSDLSPDVYEARSAGKRRARIRIPGQFLIPGRYWVTLLAHQPMVQFFDVQEQAIGFEVCETGTKLAKYQQYGHLGVVMVQLPWEDEAA